ncbi:hypothetical protein NC653_010777 [Populus alba x Populus x berolinensis]|uniref:Uncharacterized protein n=1 Tax=Populus alba x Populus x berolinensis TaxID=444605 RepID=A0AAD6W655_9ROSI|nr:hypothetical protein NC653_010777 [Populus alba x Populus x berolinensis]
MRKKVSMKKSKPRSLKRKTGTIINEEKEFGDQVDTEKKKKINLSVNNLQKPTQKQPQSQLNHHDLLLLFSSCQTLKLD